MTRRRPLVRVGTWPAAAAAAAAAAPLPAKRVIDAAYAARPIEGGRQTQPAVGFNPFGLTGWFFIPHRQYQQIDVTELDVTQFSAEQLLALLPDMVPEVGKALWNYLRFAGTDVEFHAMTADGQESASLQRELDDLILGLNPLQGGLDVILQQLETTAYLQGAACVDVAPTKNLKDVDDIFVVNPETIYFERDAEQRLVPFQRQQIWHSSGMLPYRLLNEETFFYIPVDPYVDDPYGRAPAAPILQVVFGLAQVIRDLQKVVHHQGWPRIDISVVTQSLMATMPPDVKDDPQAQQDWVAARMGEVIAAYNSIQPEDAFVHLDYVTLNSQNANVGRQMIDVGAITQILRAQLIEALKSLPIFHGGGNAEGDTETYGSIEFEIYAQSVETLRGIAIWPLVRALTVAMQLRGLDCLIEHEWPAIRTTQRLMDARAEAQEIQNEVSKRDQGWSTQDDASSAITGSDAVAPPPTPGWLPMAPAQGDPYTEIPDDEEDDQVPDVGTALSSGRGMAAAYIAAAAARMLEDGVRGKAGVPHPHKGWHGPHHGHHGVARPGMPHPHHSHHGHHGSKGHHGHHLHRPAAPAAQPAAPSGQPPAPATSPQP